FDWMSANQSTVIQLIKGMQENRLHNCENEKRWEWERIQVKLFGINIKSLTLNQFQSAGSIFIYEVSSIFITYFAATAVIRGEMTLGMMLSIQFIMGQLHEPINAIIRFIYLAQDAKMSLERLNAYHKVEDEEPVRQNKVMQISGNADMVIKDLTFRYEEAAYDALKNINIVIPARKTTAIVGTSGSGKTTLIKLLLKFYKPTSGSIRLGPTDLEDLSNVHWRAKCGVVLQDGFIYTDTIARNIAIKGEIDTERLESAIQAANIQEHVRALPHGYNSRLENGEDMLSHGQKQRLLIARAVYKNPDFVFFDEATNALDAHNEKIIMQNINEFARNKTVIVVAHRLSTVKNADQIIVLDRGEVVESGTHLELVEKKAFYFNLVRNQLELGK
ncbi:MAG: peptidase domain-containing ABC transporter, partial [Bacteroidota bacterium]